MRQRAEDGLDWNAKALKAMSAPTAISAGHTKIESAVLYLDIDVNDAREMAEQTEV